MDQNVQEECNLYARLKRRRRIAVVKTLEHEDEDVDRINEMTDSILIHILSFLDTEDAVSTGVLSKRWQYLWISNPNLTFSHQGCLSRPRFVHFVDKILAQCNNHPIKRSKFTLEFRYDLNYLKNVNSWLHFAQTLANVQHLKLDFFSRNCCYLFYCLPQHLYSYPSLEKLTLACCNVAPIGEIDWKSLKCLSMGILKLSDDVIQRILSGSPALDYLELYHFDGIRSLDMAGSSVKHLVIKDFDGDFKSMFDISGPNLLKLEILGCFRWTECRVTDVSSLEEALVDFNMICDENSYNYVNYEGDDDVHMNEKYPNMMKKLLESLLHVRNLMVGTWCIQVLSSLHGVSLPNLLLNSCKCLSLTTSIQDLYGIRSLLFSLPYLQNLIINMDAPYMTEFYQEMSLHGNPLQKWLCGCLLEHLKTVEILNFIEGNFEYELLEFLLRNAKVLEKVIIQACRSGDDSYSLCDRTNAKEKLLSFPRASPLAVLVFYE